jgi:type IV pilus assembly protein PilM
MLKSKSFLCLDFGAGSLKVGEFEPNEAGSLRLKNYAVKPLGLEGSQEGTREGTILKAIQDVLAQKNFGSRQINVCAPGFHVFSKFVKLPPVDNMTKVGQIIQYEAQQNVPFPLEEVVWDYQILGTGAGGELEVLLVAIKSDVVEGIFRTSEAGGLALHLVDVSPAALANAFRFNYGDLEGCTMLLDIGAKTSNLLFFEKGKMYSRSINIGANSITQDFATESKLSFADAEKLKIEEGFVSLGGAYEEPDSPQQALISKIARQVMTRLHIQMNQTIQFYRGQQGGSAPARLYLAGGASLMPYTAQFFAEKLNVPTDYFNPFQTIQIDEAVNLEELAKVAHEMGEVVGLGIRNLAQCPVELNLMPKSHQQRRAFDQKKPYFIATVFSLVLVVFACGLFYDWVGAETARRIQQLQTAMEPLKKDADDLRAAMEELQGANGQTALYNEVLESHDYWADFVTGFQQVFLKAEANVPKSDAVTNALTGVWIEKLEPYVPAKGATRPPYAQVDYLTVNCRAMNLGAVSPSANKEFAYALFNQMKTNALFVGTDPNMKLGDKIEEVDASVPTFGFSITIRLKKPYKIY